MKFLHLSKLSIEVQAIVAVEWDLEMADGRKTTVINHNIPRLSVFQLYSDNPKYEEDKVLLSRAIAEEVNPAIEVYAHKEETPLDLLCLPSYIDLGKD